MDGTPIYDIKPYLPYVDSHPDAAEGFTAQAQQHHLKVACSPALWAQVPPESHAALEGVLAGDPRPSYRMTPPGSTAWSLALWRCGSLWKEDSDGAGDPPAVRGF